MNLRPLAARLTARWWLYVLTALPFVTSAVRALRADWFPIGDSALLYVRAADVATRHHPLIGSWSSASVSLGRDINNPGPLYDDLMAPFARLLPTGPGNVVGVALLNLGFVILAGLSARRIAGGRAEGWVLVVASALAWTLGSELLFDMFQAHALLFPFLASLVLLAGATLGHRWTWPWLAFVWSVILQTHISYAYIAAAMMGCAVVAGVWSTPAPRSTWFSGWWRSRPALVSMGVLVVAWAQPVIEQLISDGEGNLSRLAKSAGGTDISVGFGNAFRIVAAVFTLAPWWTRWGFADTIAPARIVESVDGPVVDIPWLPGWPLALGSVVALLAATIVAVAWANRSGRRFLVAVNTLALAGLVGSVAALSRLTVGPVGLAPHHMRWLFVLALWSHAAVAATVISWWSRRRPATRSSGQRPQAVVRIALAIVGAFTLANLPAFTHRQGPLADVDTMPTLRRVFVELDRLDGLDPVLYRTDNLRLFEPYSSAIMAQLVDRGIEFRVDQEVMVRQLGPARRADGDERLTITQLQGWEAHSYRADGCVLADVSALPPADEARLAARADELRTAAASLDVSRVATGDGITDLDIELARAISEGVPEAVHRAIVEGWFAWWFEHGLVSGDPVVIEQLLEVRTEMMHWVESSFVLVADTSEPCD